MQKNFLFTLEVLGASKEILEGRTIDVGRIIPKNALIKKITLRLCPYGGAQFLNTFYTKSLGLTLSSEDLVAYDEIGEFKNKFLATQMTGVNNRINENSVILDLEFVAANNFDVDFNGMLNVEYSEPYIVALVTVDFDVCKMK
jgi:uncharacterized protein YkvS